jgi:hypothetical protein
LDAQTVGHEEELELNQAYPKGEIPIPSQTCARRRDDAELNQTSVRVERQECKGNGVDDMGGFGINRDAALFAGYDPAKVNLFSDLWNQQS